MAASTAPLRLRPHTPRDLQAYGRRYGVDYRFPTLSPRAHRHQAVLRGEVREFRLQPGMQLVTSDIEVLQRYDSLSRAPATLSIIVMLEGQAAVSLAGRSLTLRPGMALSVGLTARQGLQATQPAGQRLRALTLGLDEAGLAGLDEAPPGSGDAAWMHAWRLPTPCRQGLEQALAAPLAPLAPTAQRLLLQGLGLQLLAHGLAASRDDAGPTPPLSPGERARLERVRETLESAPAAAHRLEDLAELAAMSPASLRRKFRAAYGRSVFDYLRRCRLALAHDYLSRGYGVQQAAHFSGYRHASNFATAFRRHYGYAPSSLGRAS